MTGVSVAWSAPSDGNCGRDLTLPGPGRARRPFVRRSSPAATKLPPVDDLLRNAERHARDFDAGDLPAAPARRLAVVTCMDCRIDLTALLGLRLGDAHVIRNAGGLVTDDVLRSLILSQALLGTQDVMVVQHTGCGLHGDEAVLAARVAEATGEQPPWELGAFADVDGSVREQLDRLRAAPFLSGGARGFVYEVESGRLREVS